MKFNENYEKVFFNYSLKNPKYLIVTRDGFYVNKEIDICAFLARKFYEKFKESPSSEQLKLLIDNSKRSKGIVPHDLVDAIYSGNLNDYDDEWLMKTAEAWIKWRNFDNSLLDGIEYVKTAKVDPDNVDLIINKFKEVINDRNKLNFNKSVGLDFFNPKDHYQKLEDKIKSGKLFLDNLTGGYDTKGLVVYAGASNVGKSIWLANDAVAFTKMGYNTAVVTLEMDSHKILKRIGANMLDISMDEYDDKSKDINFISKKLKTVGQGLTPPGKLYIEKFPTSQATVLDIENYLLDLEESKGIKLKCVIIDYINIISNYRNPNSENTYMKIKQISEDLRGMSDKHDWLVISATQLKRSAFDVSDFNLEDIAESSGLVHTCDLILGIIQDSIMHADREYWLKILKIRDGEGKNSKCRYNINYEYMRLMETDDVRIPGL